MPYKYYWSLISNNYKPGISKILTFYNLVKKNEIVSNNYLKYKYLFYYNLPYILL